MQPDSDPETLAASSSRTPELGIATDAMGPRALLKRPLAERHATLELAAAEAAADYGRDPEVEAFLGFHDEEPDG